MTGPPPAHTTLAPVEVAATPSCGALVPAMAELAHATGPGVATGDAAQPASKRLTAAPRIARER